MWIILIFSGGRWVQVIGFGPYETAAEARDEIENNVFFDNEPNLAIAEMQLV